MGETIEEKREITEEVIERIEKVLILTNHQKISSNPTELKQTDFALRFIARITAANMLTRSAGPIFDNPLIREYCFTGRLPKKCFEEK